MVSANRFVWTLDKFGSACRDAAKSTDRFFDVMNDGLCEEEATTKFNEILIELQRPSPKLAPILDEAGVSLDPSRMAATGTAYSFEVNSVESNEALYDWVTSFTEDRGCPHDTDMCCGECEEESDPLYILDLPEQLFRIETTDPDGFLDSVESITEINDFVTPSGRYYEGEVDVYRRGEDNE